MIVPFSRRRVPIRGARRFFCLRKEKRPRDLSTGRAAEEPFGSLRRARWLGLQRSVHGKLADLSVQLGEFVVRDHAVVLNPINDRQQALSQESDGGWIHY